MKDTILVKIPNELKEYIKKRAKEEYTTMTHYIIMLIKKDMETRK